MLLPSGNNQFKWHEEVLSLRPTGMIQPKRFDIFPLTGGCSEGLAAFRFFFKNKNIVVLIVLHTTIIMPSTFFIQ